MSALAPALALAALIVGILSGEAAGAGEARLPMAVGAVLASLAWASRAGWVRVLAIVLACAALGAGLMQRSLHGSVASPLRAAVDHRADVVVRATLVDDPDATRWSARVLVRAQSWGAADGVPDRDAGRRTVLASASGDAATRLGILEAGETVTAEGWLAPLDGYDTRQRWRHAIATLHVTAVVGVEPARDPLARIANRARDLVMTGSDALSPTDRAVLAGFLLGDTRAVPERVEEQFRAAGLTHLTAVSGGNVAFVLALVGPVVRRLRLGGRFAMSIAVLVLFGTMTRWEPSVSRAVVMTAIALFAGYLGRPTAAIRVLVLAALALLLVDPFLVHSVGFLLSCSASLGIALLAAPITARMRGPAWMREILGVTAAAQIGVAPVLVPVFGSIPLVALPANLVAVPLAAPLTMWGMVAGAANAALSPLLPGAPRLLAVPSAALLRGLLAVADVASRVPVAIDGRTMLGLVAPVAGCAAVFRWRRSCAAHSRAAHSRGSFEKSKLTVSVTSSR